jgi:uncharacterized membrane protein
VKRVIAVAVSLWMAVLAKVMVNLKCSLVFNGGFEMHKSAQNKKRNAKMRAFGTLGLRIYHLRDPLIFARLNFAAPVWRKGFVNETIRGGG